MCIFELVSGDFNICLLLFQDILVFDTLHLKLTFHLDLGTLKKFVVLSLGQFLTLIFGQIDMLRKEGLLCC
jgi:hypothetical protein